MEQIGALRCRIALGHTLEGVVHDVVGKWRAGRGLNPDLCPGSAELIRNIHRVILQETCLTDLWQRYPSRTDRLRAPTEQPGGAAGPSAGAGCTCAYLKASLGRYDSRPYFWGMARSPFLPITKTPATAMIDIERDAIKT